MMPDDEDLLRRIAANHAGVWTHLAGSMGMPHNEWEDMYAADLGLPGFFPTNSATLLRPVEPAEHAGIAERLSGFFSPGRPGGYLLCSMWPISGSTLSGSRATRCPAMVRRPGVEPARIPPELDIVEVKDAAALHVADLILLEAFGVPAGPMTRIFADTALGTDRFRMWIGYCEGAPVSTALASVSQDVIGIYCVGTVARARRRGYARALTCHAASVAPSLPAVLQASPAGRSVYAGLGFETVGSMLTIERDRR